MKKLLALLLATMMVFTVAGCDKKAAGTETANIAGTYKLTAGLDNGNAVPADQIPEYIIELTEDGGVTMTVMGTTETGTWAQNGNVLTLTSDGGQTMDVTLEANALVFTEGSNSMTFTKQ